MRVQHEHERDEVERALGVVRGLQQARRRPRQRCFQGRYLTRRHATPGLHMGIKQVLVVCREFAH